MATTSDLSSLRLFDYSDRELLLLIDELPSEDGWVTTNAIADAVGISGDNKNRSVGSRLAGMKRFGAIEKDPEGNVTRWRVTAIGGAVAHGTLSRGIERSLEGLKPEQVVLAMRNITRKYQTAPEAASHLIRREWQFGTHRA